jgi:TRAP-type C4-dicarboxylate transport system permease small subunit
MGNVLGRIEKVLTAVSMASLLIMVCLITGDAIGRYMLNMPILAANEFTAKYLMIVAVFLGFSHGYHKGSNIRVTFLVNHFSPRVNLAIQYVVQILTLLMVIFFVVGTLALALRNIDQGMVDAPSFPVGPAYLVLPFGLSILALWLLYDIRQIRKGKSGLFVEEEAESTTSAT